MQDCLNSIITFAANFIANIMTEKKLNDHLLKKLYSNNVTSQLEALEDISKNGNSDYIPSLIDLMQNSENLELTQRISKILSEVKHSNAVPILVEYIENEKYSSIQEILVRTCWENGLDFSNYFSVFVDLLIHGEYMVAFEAFTLLENSENKISETSAQEYIHRLKEALPDAPADRQTLIHSIIQYLPALIK